MADPSKCPPPADFCRGRELLPAESPAFGGANQAGPPKWALPFWRISIKLQGLVPHLLFYLICPKFAIKTGLSVILFVILGEMKNLLQKKRLSLFLLSLLILLLGFGGGYLYIYRGRVFKGSSSVSPTGNVYTAFLGEAYDKIKQNYWKTLSDQELTHLFVLGTEKLTGQPQSLAKENKKELLKNTAFVLKQLKTTEKKKEFVARLTDIVLANLKPFGRSRLYSKKDEIALKDKVENKNPAVDQYKVLGVNKSDSQEKIKKAYQRERAVLIPKAKVSSQAAQKLAQVNKAFETLGDKDSRQIYDVSGVEPTLSYHLISPNIFYMRISKVSPTTFGELRRVTQKVNQGDVLDTLILDLRGNIGGSVDTLPYLLGPFIGKDNLAYQFFHQGEKINFQTRTDWLPSLVRYKRVVILIDGKTQSSAEIMAATMKRYNVGVLVGTTTRGWGTIEKVFQLDTQLDKKQKYSMFLVHSLTLRDDGQPIEGHGVEPMVNIKNAHWSEEFNHYFHSPTLLAVVKSLLKEK